MKEKAFWRIVQLFGICLVSYAATLDSFLVTILFFITILLFVDANMKEDLYDVEHDKREYQDQIIADLRSRLKPYLRGTKK